MLASCESLIYNDYTIIDIGKSKSAKSNNKKIEIGSFLNQEEKEQLIELLKKKVSDLNFS